eukprot:756819-Hanusia_phi.AAC.1
MLVHIGDAVVKIKDEKRLKEILGERRRKEEDEAKEAEEAKEGKEEREDWIIYDHLVELSEDGESHECTKTRFILDIVTGSMAPVEGKHYKVVSSLVMVRSQRREGMLYPRRYVSEHDDRLRMEKGRVRNPDDLSNKVEGQGVGVVVRNIEGRKQFARSLREKNASSRKENLSSSGQHVNHCTPAMTIDASGYGFAGKEARPKDLAVAQVISFTSSSSSSLIASRFSGQQRNLFPSQQTWR